MPFWQNLDLLPSSERQSAHERPKRSAGEYAQSREMFQEGLKEATEKSKLNEVSAEVLMYIELNETELKEKMQKENLQDLSQEFRSYDAKQWDQLRLAFDKGQFDLSVDQTHEGHPQISMTIDLPEGNVKEKVQLNQSLQEALIAKATGGVAL